MTKKIETESDVAELVAFLVHMGKSSNEIRAYLADYATAYEQAGEEHAARLFRNATRAEKRSISEAA